MSKKFDGFYTYQSDPLLGSYKIDKKYYFDYFVGKKIVVMEIPATADFHIHRVTKDLKEGVQYWLSSNNSTADHAVSVFDRSPLTAKIKRMIGDQFQNLDMAICGFMLDTEKYPTYDKIKGKNFLISDMFINKWFDFDLMFELCQKYKIPTLPILFTGKMEKEEEVKSFLGQDSFLSTTEKIKHILVRTIHEDLEDSATVRKGITLIEEVKPIVNVSGKKASTNEVEEVEELEELDLVNGPILNEVLDPLDDVNKTACNEIEETIIPISTKEFEDDENGLLVRAATPIEAQNKVEILKKKIDTIFSLWFKDYTHEFNELIKAQPDVVQKENLFNIGRYFSDSFVQYLIKSEYKETYLRMIKIFGEKTVSYEISLITFKAVRNKYFKDETFSLGFGG